MIASELISDSLPPLKTSDTGRQALNWMNEFLIRHLPIVNNTQLLGLISEDDILNLNDLEEPIGNYPLHYQKPCIQHTAHLFDALKLLAELNLTIIPVVDDQDNYMGVITMHSLLEKFAGFSSIREPGGILVLEMGIKDYSMSEIARIVESCGASILSVFTNTQQNSTRLNVTIKVNKQDIRDIIATFERFEYKIVGSFNKSDQTDFLKDRYDSLMRWLNI